MNDSGEADANESQQNPLAVHFGMLKASDMILVNYEGVPIGGKKYIPHHAFDVRCSDLLHQGT